MAPFWGSKKNNPSGAGEVPREQVGHENVPEQARQEEPTERTRLLPRDEHQGYLSPDDPAVR